MDSASKRSAEVFDDVAQSVAMNPDLSFEDLNALVEHKAQQRNSQAIDDFCGLSPNQMSNWMYAPFNELVGVTLSTPADLSSSPVMRYLALILDEAMQQEGSFKATSRGNLPVKLVKQASALLPEFAVAKFDTPVSLSAYAGSAEDKVEALRYSRLLAEVAGITYLRSGRFHVKKDAQKQYQAHGLNAFFLPMLEAAITRFNWGYFDGYEDDLDLRPFWLFMLWRLQTHRSVDRLAEEVATAFPDFLGQLSPTAYRSPTELLSGLIETRFIDRFLEFWGFVTHPPKRFDGIKMVTGEAGIQPLLRQTFRFSV